MKDTITMTETTTTNTTTERATITAGTRPGFVELAFTGKPDTATREALKAHGFRWASSRGVWYGKADEDTAREIINGATTEEAAPTAHKAEKAAAALDLWKATRTDALPGYGTENAYKDEARKAARARSIGYDRAVAEIVRKHLRARFPGFRFSVRSGGAGYLNAVTVELIGGYAPREYTACDTYGCPEKVIDKKSALGAVWEYTEKLLDAFDADDGDIYADYGANHDIYTRVEVYEYTATEPTPAQAAALDAFRASLEAWTVAENARRDAEHRAEMERREEERKEAEKRAAENRAKVERIEAGAVVEKIPEAEQKLYNCLQGWGKACDLADLREQVEKIAEDGRDPHRLAKPSRIVRLSEELYRDFCGLLMYNFSFLAGMGGNSTDDPRVTSWADFQKLNAEQRDSVVVYSSDCVAVCVGGETRLIIDPQGYNYARYTMIPEDGAVEPPAPDTREFYTPAPIAEQVQNITPGAVVSVFVDGGAIVNLLSELVAVRVVSVFGLQLTVQDGQRLRRVSLSGSVQVYPGRLEIPDIIRYKGNGARGLERDNAEKMELLRHYAAGRGVSALVDTVPGFKPYEARTT